MILVTGGTGLVGSHLLYKLVSDNKKVRAIYRNEQKLKHTKNVFACYTNDFETLFNAIDWVKADILDITELDIAFKNITYVYHCAAFVSFEPNKYKQLRKINIEGTANIVNCCLSHNIKKLCYVSSIATLGKELHDGFITEASIWNPEDDNNVYAITKYGAEMEVWRATQEGLNAVIVNPGVIIGAGIWNYGTGSLFKKAKKGFKYFTSGTIGLVGIEDVVSAMIALTNSDNINNRYVLVAENWTYKQFLQTLSESVKSKKPEKLASSKMLYFAWKLDWINHKITGKRRLLTKHIAKSLTTETYYSSSKILKELEFNFHPLDETIKKVANLYLKQA